MRFNRSILFSAILINCLLGLMLTRQAYALSFFSPRPSPTPKACNPAKSIDPKTWTLLDKTCSPSKNYKRIETWKCQDTVKLRTVMDFNCKKPKSSPTPKPSSSVKPSISPSLSPSPSPSASPSPSPEVFVVKPYLVYPSDKPMYGLYEQSVNTYLVELQAWYKQKVGETFVTEPLKVVRSQYDYLTMRCDPNPNDTLPPSDACKQNQNQIDGNWPMYINKAIHNGQEAWEVQNVALIFSTGGGGYAGGVYFGTNLGGWAIVGDWVLEPISGVANSWGIPCSYSDGWQCAGGVPKGTPAHELGHAFGLPHPDETLYPGQSIMRWHGDYPTVGFFPHEVEILKNSPFFQ